MSKDQLEKDKIWNETFNKVVLILDGLTIQEANDILDSVKKVLIQDVLIESKSLLRIVS